MYCKGAAMAPNDLERIRVVEPDFDDAVEATKPSVAEGGPTSTALDDALSKELAQDMIQMNQNHRSHLSNIPLRCSELHLRALSRHLVKYLFEHILKRPNF